MKKNNLFKIAGLIALITLFSKAVGFIRDVVIGQAYGASMVSDAYFYAYQIPSLALILLGGLGGPFHTATIAVFSKSISNLTDKPEKKVQVLLNSYLTLTGIVFAVLSILTFIFAHQIIGTIASNASMELQNLASTQLKIMSPIIFIGGIVGILYGISNVYNEFLFTSLSPTVASVAVIGAVMIFHKDSLGIILSWGTLIGAIGQLVLQLPVFFKSGFIFTPAFEFASEKIKTIGEILYPAMISTTIGQVNIFVDMFFASRLQEGAWSAVGYANRIFQFPVGIIVTAIVIPLFPMFSTFVKDKNWDSLRHYVHRGISTLWFVSFPILGFIILYTQDVITLLFKRGHFSPEAVLMVTQALIFLSLSIIPYVARDTITRVFYAFDDSKTPFYIAMFSILVKALMNYLFIAHLGIGAITLSTSAVTLINCVLLGYFIRKKADIQFRKLVLPTTKIILATVCTFSIGYVLKYYLDKVMPTTAMFALKLGTHAINMPLNLVEKLGIYSVVCFVLYFVFGSLFKVQASEMLLNKIKGTVKKYIPA